MTDAPAPTPESDTGTDALNVRPLDLPAIAVGHRGAVLMDAAGKGEPLSRAATVKRIADGIVPMVCHAPATARRLNTSPFPALDLLELFAFVRPAVFCRPTPGGLADALQTTYKQFTTMRTTRN